MDKIFKPNLDDTYVARSFRLSIGQLGTRISDDVMTNTNKNEMNIETESMPIMSSTDIKIFYNVS